MRIPAACNLPAEELEAGRFIIFDAQKCLQKEFKCSWLATCVEPIGILQQVLDEPSRFNPYDQERLTMDVKAVILRVSNTSSCAWLWNDLIGRIYVNNHAYKGGMKVFETVECKCQYTGIYDGEPH